tara:strand:+ start:6750 stop:7889 length:1140 start_codon:yes stop_codon:yes gene_type:complete
MLAPIARFPHVTALVAPSAQSTLPVAEDTAKAVFVGAGVLGGAILVAFVIHLVAFGVLGRLARGPGPLRDVMLKGVRWPTLLLLIVACLHLVSPAVTGSMGVVEGVLRHGLTIGLIVSVAWLLARVLDGLVRATLERFDTTVADNLEARRIHTQLVVVRRVILVTIVIVSAGAVLMTFSSARQVGTSILASAGIAGIAVGLAARPVIENLIAGLQIAFTQPIRLDDVVVIEGEWGRVEEIRSTFVVVRVWDERRLIVPLSQVISQTFQNWTRRTSEIIGTVFIRVDYVVPVDQVRQHLESVVRKHPKWDGRVCVLQVTEAGERTLELRALVSSGNSGDAFDLRCDVRESLINFVRSEFPGALPRLRAEGAFSPPDRAAT